MNLVFAAALELQKFCQTQNWRFCFIGGLAVQRWGEPRMTLDADLTLLTGFGGEERFLDPLLSAFSGRRADAREFALQSRVALLQTSSGVPLDIAFGALPFEERAVERASPFLIEETDFLITCSAEDLVVHKAFANRAQDWADIERIIMRQNQSLDIDLIREELRPLVALKEEPEIEKRLEKFWSQNR